MCPAFHFLLTTKVSWVGQLFVTPSQSHLHCLFSLASHCLFSTSFWKGFFQAKLKVTSADKKRELLSLFVLNSAHFQTLADYAKRVEFRSTRIGQLTLSSLIFLHFLWTFVLLFSSVSADAAKSRNESTKGRSLQNVKKIERECSLPELMATNVLTRRSMF